MSSKRGYLTPAVIDPPERRCVTFYVPNDQLWWAAFWGQMTDLSNSWLWEGTSEQREEITSVWTDVLELARTSWLEGACGMAECDDCLEKIRLKVNNATGEIEMSLDGGDTYLTTGQTTNIYQTLELDTSRDEEDSRCAMAANLFIWLMDKYGDVLDQIEANADFATSLDPIIALFPPLYISVDQIGDAFNEVVEATVGLCRASDTVILREEAKCWLFCNSQPWGEMSATDWENFLVWLEEDSSLNGNLAAFAMLYYLRSIENKAIAAQVRRWQLSEGACGDCGCNYDWTHVFDFKGENSYLGWVNRSPFESSLSASGIEAGVYYNEPGSVSSRRVDMLHSIPYPDGTTRIAKVRMVYSGVDSGNGNSDPELFPLATLRVWDEFNAQIPGETTGNHQFLGSEGEISMDLPGTTTILDSYKLYAANVFTERFAGDEQPVTGSGWSEKWVLFGFGKNPFIA